MRDFTHALSRDRLDALAAKANVDAPHLAGIVNIVRDCGVHLLIVPQLSRSMSEELAKAQQPFIALLGDDTDRAVGPNFFDKSSLDRLIGMVDAAAVIASAPRADVYNTVGSLAVLLARNVLIVETRPEQEIAWTQAIQRVRPCLPTLLCTVETARQ